MAKHKVEMFEWLLIEDSWVHVSSEVRLPCQKVAVLVYTRTYEFELLDILRGWSSCFVQYFVCLFGIISHISFGVAEEGEEKRTQSS